MRVYCHNCREVQPVELNESPYSSFAICEVCRALLTYEVRRAEKLILQAKKRGQFAEWV